jgi:tRNA-specific 2-thiouridylase
VHMKLHDAGPAPTGSKTCCGLDDALDARRVADRLGIAFHVMDLREAFQKAVVDDLVSTYLGGATPNPCIQCNGVLKFRVLLSRALALGASKLATGHYARVVPGEPPELRVAVDGDKDQTYFLFPVTPKALARTLFPLGELSKAEVRGHARRLGLVTAEKPESQEICFIPDQDHAGFIARARPGLDGAGEIVDEEGNILGQHDGYWRYTVGQRRGLGVALGRRVYVSRIEPETRRVVLAGPDALRSPGLSASGWIWHDRPEPGAPVEARIRHQGRRLPARVGPGEGPEVRFDEPAWGVSPGQAVVIYRGEKVLGGAWIRRALEE